MRAISSAGKSIRFVAIKSVCSGDIVLTIHIKIISPLETLKRSNFLLTNKKLDIVMNIEPFYHIMSRSIGSGKIFLGNKVGS